MLRRLLQALQAVLCAAFLSACGSGGDTTATPPTSTTPLGPVAPTISVQPQSQSGQAGATLTLSVTATGSAPLNYQWQRNGIDVTGATNASYSFQPSVADNGSTWTVKINDALGGVTSEAATLAVAPRGEMTFLDGVLGGRDYSDDSDTSARFSNVRGIAADSFGNIFISDTSNHTVKKMNPAGTVSTIAGTPGESGFADGLGSTAKLNGPSQLATDATGNVYVADTGNHVIRKITPSGMVITVAGRPGQQGFDDGNATAARFSSPSGIALDAAGNILVADTGNQTIRKVSTAGWVTTLAGHTGLAGHADGVGTAATFTNPGHLALNSTNKLYVTTGDASKSTLRTVTRDGAVSTVPLDAWDLGLPGGIAIDASDTVYFGNTTRQIIKLSPTGEVSTLVAGQTSAALDQPAFSGCGPTPCFYQLGGLAVDKSGNLFAADIVLIRKVWPNGAVSTVAGQWTISRFFPYPESRGSLSSDRSGNLYYAIQENGILKKATRGGNTSSLPTRPGRPRAVNVDSRGTLFLMSPIYGMAFGHYDYTGDASREPCRFCPEETTYLSKWVPGDTVTDWLITDTNGAAGALEFPVGMVMNAAETQYVAEVKGTIRAITPQGIISTLAATGHALRAIALDASGNIFAAADFVDTQDNAKVFNGGILKITPQGVVTTYAKNNGSPIAVDGPAGKAHFGRVNGIALDSKGNLYFADATNSTIRQITPNGFMSTVAGKTGSTGMQIGTLPGSMSKPYGLALDGDNTLYVNTGDAMLKLSFKP